ncbi:MAG: glycosyltransferase family 4 protein [Anaerolineales bacterium]
MISKPSPGKIEGQILFIGNLLSHHVGTKGVSEILAEKLGQRDWQVITTSCYIGKTRRLVDMLWTIWNCRGQYQVAHIDVFSGSAFFLAEVTSIFLRLLEKQFILTLRGGRLVEFSKRWQVRVRRLLTKADVVTTPSHFLKANLQGFRDDILYIPNGMDSSAYTLKLRRNPSPKLIWLRAFHEIYHPIMAVEVMDVLRDTFPDIHLIMIGPDKKDGSFESVQRLATAKGLQSWIEFVGSVPKNDVPLWLQKGDIFLNTTRYESFGVSVMEAAACGLPVVSTNVGEIPFLWEDGEDILLVPSGDSEAMANAVKRILTEPRLTERLSSNARKKAEGFDWSFILPRWEQSFAQLLEQEG